jgi:hypothetical protein
VTYGTAEHILGRNTYNFGDGQLGFKTGIVIHFRTIVPLKSYLQSSSTLQQAQTTALLSLLNLNTVNDTSTVTNTTATSSAKSLKLPTSSGPPVWKILVLDQQTKDILATVLRVQDLRDVGVTLHVYVPSITYR